MRRKCMKKTSSSNITKCNKESYIVTVLNDVEVSSNNQNLEFFFKDIPSDFSGNMNEFFLKLLDDNLYWYLLHFFDTWNWSVIVRREINGDRCCSRKTKIDFLKFCESKGLEQDKINQLKEKISYHIFQEDYRGKNFSLNIEGNPYEIKWIDIIFLLTTSPWDFYQFCKFPNNCDKFWISHKQFLYEVSKIIQKENLLGNYILPKDILLRIKEINENEAIDNQYIDSYTETTDTLYQKIDFNEELKQKIFEWMPKYLTKLEQVIFVYIKMCTLLTYSDEYWAFEIDSNFKQNPLKSKYRGIDLCSNVTVENNKIVCFQFSLLFSKILNELWCTTKVINWNEFLIGGRYWEYHSFVQFKVDKYLVQADPAIVFHSDLSNAKFNFPLKNFNCLNKNQKTKKEFDSAVKKIYHLVKQQKNTFSRAELNTLKNMKKRTLKEKLDFLIKKLQRKNVIWFDAVNLFLKYKEILLNDEEKKNFQFEVVRRNKWENFSILCLFWIKNSEKMSYFLFDPHQQENLKEISVEDLRKKRDDWEFIFVRKKKQ